MLRGVRSALNIAKTLRHGRAEMEPSMAGGAEQLRRYLKSLAPGKVERKSYLTELLAACWEQIPSSGLERMTTD